MEARDAIGMAIYNGMLYVSHRTGKLIEVQQLPSQGGQALVPRKDLDLSLAGGGFTPMGITASNGKLYVATGSGAEVYDIQASGALVPYALTNLGTASGLTVSPTDVTADEVGKEVFLLEDQQIVVVDEVSGAVKRELSIAVGNGAMRGMVFDPVRRLLFVNTAYSDNISALDPVSGQIPGTTVGVGSSDDVA